jgi:RND family efflux transporter MFP subunit
MDKHPPQSPFIKGEFFETLADSNHAVKTMNITHLKKNQTYHGLSFKTFFMLIFVIILLPACTSDEDPETPEASDDVEILPEVIFSLADDRDLNVYIESQGVVEASREIIIRPRISGFVEATVLEDGARAQQGDLLLEFDDQEWQYQLQEAENEYETALAAYTIESGQRESRNEGSDSTDNEMTDDRMVRISTGLAAAETALNRARLNLSYTRLTAPFSGHLSIPDRISRGAYLQSGTELGRLIDDSTVRVRLDVLESELLRLEEGMEAHLSTPSGVSKQGIVKAISPVVDSESKTGKVVVEVENSDRSLRPGMTVEGRIQIESHSGIARVPRSAILERDGGRTLVFKLVGETVEWVYVEPEIETSDWAIINSEDISPGDTLAVDRHFAISHLQKVRPRMTGEIVQEGSED